jgi:ferredoxin/coenzyme F420-reducing hydrogenase delta subunit
MPASEEEVNEAAEEGVEIVYLTSPLEILGTDGKVSGLKCIRNELGEPDAEGRRRPSPIPGSEYTLDVELVICAIGQVPQSRLFAEDFDIAERGKRIHVEESETLATTQRAVFAGGDAVTGPATLIRAISAGKQAAISIDAYLADKAGQKFGGGELGAPRLPERITEGSKKFDRCAKQTLDVETRRDSFDEVEACLPEKVAVQEALRCLHCYLNARIDPDTCISCLTCVRVCPLEIPKANQIGEVVIDPVECQACGMCVVECPVRAIDIGLNRRAGLFKEMEKAKTERGNRPPKIVGIFDLYGNFTAEDMDRLRQDYPDMLALTVFGLRRLDAVDIFKAFGLGAKGVLLAKSPIEEDPFPEKADRVERIVEHTRDLLEALGKRPEQLALYDMPKEGIMEKTWMDEWIEQLP